MTTSCGICAETFTESQRKKVECPSCHTESCISCIKKWLISGSKLEATCMSCGIIWSREFLDSCLSRHWMMGTYKCFRQDKLMEKEKTLLPETTPRVENYTNAVKLQAEKDELKTTVAALKKQLKEAQSRFQIVSSQLETLTTTNYRIGLGDYRIGLAETHKDVAKVGNFVRKCPTPDCRGFLSTAYKCSVCEKFTCSKCLESKGGDRDANHTCEPNALASAQVILQESKPCPSCGELISKIDGCDLMWCVLCHKNFSWKTGLAVETNWNHNPHYFEWLRREGKAIPRTPGDNPCIPGNLMRLLTQDDSPQRKYFFSILRMVNELRADNNSNVFRNRIRGDEFEKNIVLRLRYLTSEIDDVEFKRLVQQRDLKEMKNLEVHNIRDTFINAATDVLTQVATKKGNPTENAESLGNLCSYIQEQFEAFSTRFKCKSPYTVEFWNRFV